MKIDRLIGILAILLQQEQVTAPYLAEKFEVSKRTISRDIESLCQAGIPLVTTQGRNGGISIMDGYTIDRTILTSTDIQAIFTGLRSLDRISSSNKYQLLMDKLSAENTAVLASNHHIMIDLTSWYKSSLAPKIELLQKAIENHELVSFYYYSPNREGERTIEPYLLVFQWTSWYIRGYCLERSDYRLFKLNRIVNLISQETIFEPRQPASYEIRTERLHPFKIKVKALFQPSLKWRLIEEYGIDSFTEQLDGTLLFQFGFTQQDNLICWLLSFGNQVELLEPAEIRQELQKRALQIYQTYHNEDRKIK